MNSDWLKIKGCFKAMQEAPDEPPKTCRTHNDLARAAAKFMKPRGDALAIRKLASRVQFIAFGE
jgi:hypothetical protein